jgi:hypothetical protein
VRLLVGAYDFGATVAMLSPCFIGVHRNQFFKFRPEPDLAGPGKKFLPEVPAGTGTDLLSNI